MREPSYIIKPLDSRVVGLPANIRFVNEDEPAAALKAMFNAAMQPGGPCNVAILLNSGSKIDEEALKRLNGWCRDYGFAVTQGRVGRADAFRGLARIFNSATGGDSAAAAILKPLHKYIESRLQAMAQAFPDKDVCLTIKANYYQTRTGTAEAGNPHVDGGAGVDIRFVETLAGGGTCLVGSETEKPVTFWQIPEGQLALLTSRSNAARPVVHTAPPQKTLAPGQIRIVLLYDLVSRSNSVWGRIFRLSR